jgi:hypothetical protein
LNLTATDIVKPSDERPARLDGTCFYCSQPMGAKHKDDCVIVSKSVVLHVAIEVVVNVPRHWNEATINLVRNAGTWCKGNLLNDLGAWVTNKSEDAPCGCGCTEIKFVRDACEADHHQLPDLCKIS